MTDETKLPVEEVPVVEPPVEEKLIDELKTMDNVLLHAV
jgi:hypothetical protein